MKKDSFIKVLVVTSLMTFTFANSVELLNAQINSRINKSLKKLNKKNHHCQQKKLSKTLAKALTRKSFLKDLKATMEASKGRKNLTLSDIALDPSLFESFFISGFENYEDYHVHKNPIEDVINSRRYFELVKSKKTGEFKNTTIVASFEGMRFWNDLINRGSDVLNDSISNIECINEKWEVSQEIDFNRYLNHGLTEHFENAINVKRYLKYSKSYNLATTAKEARLASELKSRYQGLTDFLFSVEYSLNNLGDLSNRRWKRLPQYIRNLIATNTRYLQYDSNSHYIRKFRKKSKRGSRSNNISYRNIDYTDIELKSDLSVEQVSCFYTFVSGGDCDRKQISPLPASFTKEQNLDLLKHSRNVSRINGLVVARDDLIQRLKSPRNIDIQRRVLNTTKDKTLLYADSIATIEKERRKEIGVYFVLGIGGEGSDNAMLMKQASERVAEMGFTSEMLQVSPELGSDYNAKMLRHIIKERIFGLKKVVFVAASKGVADFVTYFLNYADSLKQEQRDKIKLMVSLSGVIRGSFVAKYLSSSYGATALFVRNLLRMTGKKDTLKGILSLAVDPWLGKDRKLIAKKYPQMKWISFPAIGEAKDGLTNLSLWSGFLKKPVHRWTEFASPGDGLVESAASILPPDTDIDEIIVPIYGPHAMALGRYENGLKVAPLAQKGFDNKVIPASGPEMLDAYFRALPKSLLQEH